MATRTLNRVTLYRSLASPRYEDHRPIPPEKLPLRIALREHRPVHMRLWMVGLDNVERYIQTTCLPLIVEAGRFLGAIAIFWEIDD